MSENLIRRTLTSLFLITLFVICFFLSNYSWLILLIIASFISFLEFNILFKKIYKKKLFLKYTLNIISIFYLILFISCLYFPYLYNLYNVFLILLVCIFSDIGGYVVGKTIGGKKLTKISPNKTISGSIGSFIFSLFPIIIYLLIYDFTKIGYWKMDYYLGGSFLSAIIICLTFSFFCQIGDLFVSYFKRKAKVKDTGSILPGHGGILDRIDGILLAVPAMVFFSIIINFFVK